MKDDGRRMKAETNRKGERWLDRLSMTICVAGIRVHGKIVFLLFAVAIISPIQNDRIVYPPDF